jgi:hypothetical protein
MEVEPWHFDEEVAATLSFRGALALGELLEQFVC